MPEYIATALTIDSDKCRLAAATRVLHQESTVNAFCNQTVLDLLTEVVITYRADHRDRDAKARQRDQSRCHRATALQKQCRQFGFLVQFRIIVQLAEDIQRALPQANNINLSFYGHGIAELKRDWLYYIRVVPLNEIHSYLALYFYSLTTVMARNFW